MESKSGYQYLLSYQYSSLICDFTFDFCRIFLPGRELLRQRDQMTQAARSGKQNIVEGYSLESLENYIKFLGIAKGSLKELLEDYYDYLRQHHLPILAKDSPEMRNMREMRIIERQNIYFLPQFPHLPHNPQLAANLLIMLIQRTTYLLDKQIDSLKTKFIQEGGFRENLFKQRQKYRLQNQN